MKRAGASLGALVLVLLAGVWWLERPSTAPGGSPAGGVGPARSTAESAATRPEAPLADVALEEPQLDLPPLDPKDDAESREVVRFAREADLGKVQSLERMLAAEQPLVAGNALRALGRLGLVTPSSKYASYLSDPRVRVRQEAIRALGLSGDASAIASLAAVVQEGSLDERRLAIQGLGEIGGDPAVAALERIVPRDATEATFHRAALEAARRPAREAR